jgi:hypothetical protein
MDPEKESCGISFASKEKNHCFDEITLSIVVGLVREGKRGEQKANKICRG